MITFLSLDDLEQALKEIEQPVIETPGVDGPQVSVYSDGGGSQTFDRAAWTHVETDYPAWARRLATWAAAR